MIRVFTVLLFITIFNSAAFGRRDIDFNLLQKINGTKWTLVEERKNNGLLHQKNKHPRQETITFSDSTILFDLADLNYACNYKRVDYRLWLSCVESDQFIYTIWKLSSKRLIIDIQTRTKHGFIKSKRVTYLRKF